MLNALLILLRFSPYILIFSAGFYLKGCMTDKLISDLKNQVIENQEKIIITERKLNDYNNNVVTQTFDFIKKNDEIFNSAYKFDFNGNIYGKQISITFFKKIRDERKFKSAAELKHQLQNDEKEIRKHILL